MELISKSEQSLKRHRSAANLKARGLKQLLQAHHHGRLQQTQSEQFECGFFDTSQWQSREVFVPNLPGAKSLLAWDD